MRETERNGGGRIRCERQKGKVREKEREKVREREREKVREGEKEGWGRERKRGRDREFHYVTECVCRTLVA